MNLHVHVSDLLYLYPDLTHTGDFYRNGYQSETKQQNNAYLKIQTKLTWSIDNKVKCNTDNFMQYGWVWTENIQQLKWLICTALATNVVLCLICFINLPLPHPYLGIFAEMVINQKLRHDKLNNVDQSNAKSQMQ